MSKTLESPSDLSDKHPSLPTSPSIDEKIPTLPTLSRTGALTSPDPINTNEEKDDQTDTSSQTSAYIPQRYRWIAFSMIIFFATGSSFAEGTLGPLKSTLVKNLKINSKSHVQEEGVNIDMQMRNMGLLLRLIILLILFYLLLVVLGSIIGVLHSMSLP